MPAAAIQGAIKNIPSVSNMAATLQNAGALSFKFAVAIDVIAYQNNTISFEECIGSISINGLTFAAQTVAVGAIATVSSPIAIPVGFFAAIGIGVIGAIANKEYAESIGELMCNVAREQFKNLREFTISSNSFMGGECDPTHPFGKAATTYRIDPIVLDLNGDGITFGSATDGYAQFDLDNNGFKERAAWLNAQDGFLARDINGNGLIDDGSELFGDRTTLKNGKIAASGFEALKDLDDNNDGILDKLDKAFQTMKIWQDKDRDGITDEGELSSLADLSITSIWTCQEKCSQQTRNILN